MVDTYSKSINQLTEVSFENIRNTANASISHLPRGDRDVLWAELNRGTALLDSHEHMCQYLFSFGNMHTAKLKDAFSNLPSTVFSDGFEIVDWGCGQALGTVNLFDYIKTKGFSNKVKKVTLIEPSKKALERAVLHVGSYLKDKSIVHAIADYFGSLKEEQITSASGKPVIHIFSNILDIGQIDLKGLANLIDQAVVSDNYMVCVGPLNPNNQRIDAFYNYFNVPLIYCKEAYQFNDRNWTYKCKLYKLTPNETGNLIPIEFYPSVQFHAVYELDMYRVERKRAASEFYDSFSVFETSAPFDIGASVYDDVHPILAVLSNIITRGLPTKASVFLEDIFASQYERSAKEVNLGEVFYRSKVKLNYEDIVSQIQQIIVNQKYQPKTNFVELEELLTPIAVARFQKIIIEALITGHLQTDVAEWDILVEEHDVPFGALALRDLADAFHHLTQLSEEYCDMVFPKVNLDVISNAEFFNSPLHLDANVSKEANAKHFKKKYHLVVDMAILKLNEDIYDSFSRFHCLNNCYFKIRSVQQEKKPRTIYTASLIKYKNLVKKENTGEYTEVEESKEHLNYFLQLIFRKESFRPGQLPILDRALQNQPVIGLLPTGGGKSLTYQISALLQPGITLVIDPLKSLMKDQYDGLINNGIDNCTYINSADTAKEKVIKEQRMESSELLFVFISPERLSIAKFRERLRQMHNYNVYFSYGVIDEVHCVSEWGHDFRFSYLHLGRNLYNYVRAKDNAISLFGLTATASFDVLADVERELSGNGTFELDSDTIVRYENTNRLELQYKVELVPVKFAIARNYDRQSLIDKTLPKALDVTNNWEVYDSKSDFLKDYINKIPKFIKELQTDGNLLKIKERFSERQSNTDNLSNDIRITMDTDFFKKRSVYEQSGIVFCPHAKSTGVSVEHNVNQLREICEDIGSFSGKDSDTSMTNLELFKDDRQAIMVATKAFGMGIDKPNVRFTVNMNYSSSLESFVQEAGRAGRDRKTALSVILISDYELSKIKSSYPENDFPFNIIKNKWFHKKDLKEILDFYQLQIKKEFVDTATPERDMVKVFCTKDDIMFRINTCEQDCSQFSRCQLRRVSEETKEWQTEDDLRLKLREQNIVLQSKDFQYLSADYEAMMYFFKSSFKGDVIEKTFMHDILSRSTLGVQYYSDESKDLSPRIEINGFLKALMGAKENESILAYVPYLEHTSTDISKAIYRMCCIELIEDFTQDYGKREYRILVKKKNSGEYYTGLENFLLRYYTAERALIELEKAKNFEIKTVTEHEIVKEIHRCLAYLTEFVYEKISQKRKRAIDDIRSFCIEGTNPGKPWIERNEDLKDHIYYYFNSKYAKSDYVTENGLPYSLTEDTDGGKKANSNILFKYLKVIKNEIVGVGTPTDNVKHLQGAVRLLRRSLTDKNPTLSLLNVFTLSYLGTKKNSNLEAELREHYIDGMQEFAIRMNYDFDFWDLFNDYNKEILIYKTGLDLESLVSETELIIHSNKLNDIVEKYTDINE